MKYYLFNGSPRSNRNTAKMLESAKKGIIDKFQELRPDEDCDVMLIDLFKLNYKGCMSCFNCKLIDGPFYGKCPINDDLKDLLEDVWDCDGLIIGSPIYFGELTGQTRNLLERLIFPKLVYGGESLSTNRMPTALFLTMNVNEELFNQLYTPMLENTKVMMNIAFKEPVVLQAYNTVQFDDYSKYENYAFDPDEKHAYEEENFPKTLEEAYNIGCDIVEKSLEK